MAGHEPGPISLGFFYQVNFKDQGFSFLSHLSPWSQVKTEEVMGRNPLEGPPCRECCYWW